MATLISMRLAGRSLSRQLNRRHGWLASHLLSYNTVQATTTLLQARLYNTTSHHYYVSPDDDTDQKAQVVQPLVSLCHAQLQYPQSTFTLHATKLDIGHARHGGHVILGPNGAGKSLISNAIAQAFQQHRAKLKRQQQPAHDDDDDTDNTTYFQTGHMSLSDDQVWHGQAVAHVSFESHEELLALREDNDEPISVQKAIASGGALNKAAQFLVVRFGLFPLLHRQVTSLSTGEIRKVLLVKALAHRPRLLVLDNAFDGLDVPSRTALKDLVERTLQGFRPDILVQAVDAKATAHTQVVMMTHRAEEIVDSMQTVSYLVQKQETHDDGNHVQTIIHTEERQGRSGQDLLQRALLQDAANNDTSKEESLSLTWPEENDNNDSMSSLPSPQTVQAWWQQGRSETTSVVQQKPLVSMTNLTMQRGQATLLKDLNWTVERGHHWWIAGGNGVGKSTLSRLLARQQQQSGIVQGTLEVVVSDDNDDNTETGDRRRRGVGWVSTEEHMALARSPRSIKDVLTSHYAATTTTATSHNATTPLKVATCVLQWLDMPAHDQFLQRPFAQLSQGEQKLVLIAAALAARPKLLVLDEPCQGLDAIKRKRVLQLVERIISSTQESNDIQLIYITHHPEEVMPSISHVLHLAKGQDVFQGSRDEYDADIVAKRADSVSSANNNTSSSAKKTLV
ncbi:Putative molybdenum transport ATP-binding protein ModF [Seminavis robusta]|uniref:Molybdenum transport ATP-binding protein ModF n=1 Tax=Seminavis robusta TaxID=568900 RepID=A0A9N8HMJ2_9STRA|nr:Putative molybdenum transport ATP-binding protein ModF [Seminavis robusta]|eukprot:Sro1124_g243740.1 Putative molybdenum transport ATP-binding protein ModF (679) ;mRNA; f:2138-4174